MKCPKCGTKMHFYISGKFIYECPNPNCDYRKWFRKRKSIFK